jgi:hypothetical protein
MVPRVFEHKQDIDCVANLFASLQSYLTIRCLIHMKNSIRTSYTLESSSANEDSRGDPYDFDLSFEVGD